MSFLSSLHLYPKTPRDLTVKTKVGGLISFIAVATMSLLFATELRAYLSSRFETTLSLDDNNDQKLLIDFALRFPRVPCHVIGVEVSDVFGKLPVQQGGGASNVYKHKIDAAGRVGELVGGSVSSTGAGRQLAEAGCHGAGCKPASSYRDAPAGVDESDFEKQPLAPADFDAAVESFELVLVNFYAPWCPHCIQFAPIWAEAGRLVDESEFADNVVLAKFDCNEHARYCDQRHAIDRFPTVRAYANGGDAMVPYEGNLGDVHAIVAYVKQVMRTRDEARAEAESPHSALSFAVNETVQVWFHNVWRDAVVTARVTWEELAAQEEGSEAREYKIKFVSFVPPEGRAGSEHRFVVLGGLIRVSAAEEELDGNVHEVSVHIMRAKAAHPQPFKKGDRVQLRVASGWLPAEVQDTRPVADNAGPNCTAWAKARQCEENPRMMLVDCARSCRASSHGTQYLVAAKLSQPRWVMHERLIPQAAELHVTTHEKSSEGCELSGQLMVSRVPGSLMVKIDGRAGGHAHAFNTKSTNLSHVVQHLSFGYSDRRRNDGSSALLADLAPSLVRARNPLDGATFASERTHESHMHYLKVIRTTVSLLSHLQRDRDMYHFTASSSAMTVAGPPRVTFSYDLSPMQVLITEETEGLFRFVVFCFAILGGGFTVFGLFDSVVFHGNRLLREKVGLGKQG